MFKNLTRVFPITLILTMVILCTSWYIGSSDFFFWDTVQLASKQAHFFFENSFFHVILPQEIDSGHFPLFGMYLASWWMVFEKSLWISHLAMLPWVIFLAVSIFRLSELFIPGPYRICAILLLSFEPTLLAQVSLVSPDIILITTFLWAIILYFRKQNFALSLVFIILCLISMRGFIIGCSLFLCGIILSGKNNKLTSDNPLFAFIPGIFLSVSFFVYHYYNTSWVGFHEGSPWSESFSRIGMTGLLKNTMLFLWRMVDFGRIFIISSIMWLLFIKKEKPNDQSKTILLLLFISGIVMYLVTVGFQSLTAHRYYLPLYMLVILFFSSLLFGSSLQNKTKNRIAFVMTLGLVSGHFWIYPDKIAQGWDASLAHRPAFSLYKKMDIYLQENEINKNEIAAFFPFLSEEKFLLLNEKSDKFSTLESKTTKYTLLSNLFNDAPDSLFVEFKKDKALYYSESHGVWLALFKNNAQ